MNSVESKSYKNAGNPAVLRHVPEEAIAILDVGCGAGDNARLLARPGRVIDGVTLSLAEREEALKYCRHVAIHDLEKGLPEELKGRYDCVICSHVLEHICWPGRLLRDIRGCLQGGGVLVVALPNLLFYKNRWCLFRGKFDYEESGLMDNTHFRWYSFQSAQEMLVQNGFQITGAVADGSFPIPFRKSLAPRCIVKTIDSRAVRAWPGLFGYQMVFTSVARSEGY